MLAKLERDKADITVRMYRNTLTEFMKWADEQRPKITQMKKISEKTIMEFIAHRREEENWEPRTAHDNRQRVDKFCQVEMGLAKLLTEPSQTKWTAKMPTKYEEEDVEKFLAACKPQYKLAFETLYKTGLRIAELSLLEWSDLNFNKKTFRIHEKPGFIPKENKERIVRVPSESMAKLEAVKKPKGYVFAVGKKPFKNWWWVCQRTAKAAGFDPTEWHPHKFRATHISKLLNDGVELPVVMQQVGHGGLASTQLYGSAETVESDEFGAELDKVFAGKKAKQPKI